MATNHAGDEDLDSVHMTAARTNRVVNTEQ